MKFKSGLVTQASGSVGGMTASHNRGGLYLRARSIPTNPGTAGQVAVRNFLSTLALAWNNTLTQVQRDAWGVYALNTPRTDSLGEPRNLTALDWFIACNVPRLQVGYAIIVAAPTTFAMAALTNPAVTGIVASTKVITITFSNTDNWATAATGALAVFASPPQNPGIAYYKGPYRFAGKISGASTPPTSPQTVTGPFALAAGNRQFIQLRALGTDGRISSPFRTTVLAT